MRISQRKAFAEGTFGNIFTQWVKFLSFSVFFELPILPASTEVLTWYAQYLSRKHKAHNSVVNYVSGVKKMHEMMGYSTAGFKGILLRLTLQGLKRTNTHVTRRARPMTLALLRQIYSKLNLN